MLARHVRNKRLYDAIDQWLFCALTRSPGARAFDDRHRANGDTHPHGCLRHHMLYGEHKAPHTRSRSTTYGPGMSRPRGNHPRSGLAWGWSTIRRARDHLNGRDEQTMTEQPGLPDQFKELVTENEKRMKAIQEQIATQLEAQRKAFEDLVESQQKAFADFLEQQRSGKLADHWEAQRKAISEQVEHQRKALTDLVERQWAVQKKAIEDAQHAIVGRFRPKPDEPKPDE